MTSELSNAESNPDRMGIGSFGTGYFHPAVRLFGHHVAEGAPSKGQFFFIDENVTCGFWQTYDASEMKLNPDLTENALTRKQ
ncbi:hypothetical protein OS493_039578 [Desmophyllum pertusum]|uniref:Uncharacterized protein n=1 Tax=Desmophyllum pertusum TaxID=174260 RepID=A0A9W9YU49_9CNID|nr:hypothetical protein OS493_039578 [Desmophyllum pertusum]